MNGTPFLLMRVKPRSSSPFLETINRLLKEANENPQMEIPIEDTRDNVPITVPSTISNTEVEHYVHPDVKALLDELIETIDQLTLDAIDTELNVLRDKFMAQLTGELNETK